MSNFTLERRSAGTRGRVYFHVIVDKNGTKYGENFGDASGPRDAEPWLKALESAYHLGRENAAEEQRIGGIGGKDGGQ